MVKYIFDVGDKYERRFDTLKELADHIATMIDEDRGLLEFSGVEFARENEDGSRDEIDALELHCIELRVNDEVVFDGVKNTEGVDNS